MESDGMLAGQMAFALVQPTWGSACGRGRRPHSVPDRVKPLFTTRRGLSTRAQHDMLPHGYARCLRVRRPAPLPGAWGGGRFGV